MSKSRFYCLLLLLLAVCTFHASNAQRYPFYNLNVENGLIQSQAKSIVQDRFGHLWIGTIGGLSRYDGKTFVNYTVRDGMTDNTVDALAVDDEGNIWIGTPKGITQYDGRTFRHFVFQSPENPNANAVSSIKSDAGKIWCIAGNRLYTIANGKSNAFKIPGSTDSVTTLLPEKNGLWIANTRGTIYHYTGKKWDSLTFNEPQLKGIPYISAIFRDSRQRIWLATSRGLYNIDSNRIHVAHVRDMPLYGLPPILTIAEDKNKNIWLGTVSGAFRLKDSSLAYCNKKNGLTDNAINQLLTDAEGNIWMATDGLGVYRFSGAQFSVVDESTGLPSAQVMSIAAQGNRLFLGTYDAGLYLFENGTVSKVAIPLPGSPAITAINTNGGDVWIGTRGAGLWRYRGTSFRQYTEPAMPSNLVSCLYTDEERRMWVGFWRGAGYFQRDTFHRVSVPPATVECIISIGRDSVLIGMSGSNGLRMYNDGTVTQFITNSAPDSASPQCFTKRGDELWIGTSDNGLICYNLRTKTSFVLNKGNGLQSDFIYNITTDKDGHIWAGTGYGIHRISMVGGKPVIQFYGRGQGIKGMESNHNAVYNMPDGSIWFGTTNGAVHYNPQSQMVSAEPISVVMQSVKVFGENISDTTYFDSTDAWNKVPERLHLPYKKNNLTFTFQGICLSGAEQLRYRYRIDGLENQWSDWSNVNTVTYSALPPGKYTLLVECTSGDSTGIKELKYPFEIVTPFQKTGWFRLAVLGACILLGVTIQYIVNKRKQNRQALLDRLRREEQNKVRERTAEDFHDEVGNKLTRINVLTNVLKNKIGPMSPDAKRIIDQIQDNTGQLYSGTKDILWSLKPTNDSLYEILHRIRDFGGELFQDTEIDFIFTGTDEKWKNYRLPMDISRNLIMIFKEALNNCLKYSGATRVELIAELRPLDVLHMELKDNGKGFDIDTVKRGHGIDNMNVRARRLAGKLYIDPMPGKGTYISLTFRLPESNKSHRIVNNSN